jgi:hypothetical protein
MLKAKLFLLAFLLSSTGLFAQSNDPGRDEFIRQATISEGNSKALFEQYLQEEAELLARYPDLENSDWKMMADFLRDLGFLRKKWLTRTLSYLKYTEAMLNTVLVTAQKAGYPMTHEYIYDLIKRSADRVDE